MKLRVFLLLSILCCATAARAQSPHFQSYFLLRKGEPVQINKVFQDSKGYIWFASNKGLFRFDGVNQLLIEGTVEDPVTALAEDKTGTVWIGRHSGRLWSIGADLHPVAFDPPEGSAAAEISDIIF